MRPAPARARAIVSHAARIADSVIAVAVRIASTSARDFARRSATPSPGSHSTPIPARRNASA